MRKSYIFLYVFYNVFVANESIVVSVILYAFTWPQLIIDSTLKPYGLNSYLLSLNNYLREKRKGSLRIPYMCVTSLAMNDCNSLSFHQQKGIWWFEPDTRNDIWWFDLRKRYNDNWEKDAQYTKLNDKAHW